ncbi:hypothetical protein ITJ57_06005 [Plantibacter sp. VKM Ac-2880]|uniref:hypothetical protein n=1 Tax=Plantibacter sp. VKM Ac-2880 TaxID=2783827 RepID=UPI00188E2385|nr:hypothetical protein [Plantibacter sp. VKM Ac-2880]MBF4568320.1 hypothetical protein [Plantibacter sp. VKM Ac-2880]
MANWTAENPGEIDSGALATTATTIQTTETSLSEARTVADTARAGISDAIWTGDAAAAWTSSLATPIGKIDAVLPEMAAVRTAIATYTTTVDDIKTRATSYKEMIVQASLTAAVQYLDAVGGPDPVEQARRDQLRQTAQSDQATAQRLLDELSAEREAADAALVTALSSPGGDSWDSQQAALAAIGITSAAGLNPHAIAQGMADMAAELGNGTFESDLAAQLQSLYSLYGNNPSVMAQMNLALGGEDLISLISRIDEAGANGWMAPGAALLLAQSVRGGLSVGSQRWTDGVGREFAQELYDGSASVHGTNSWTSLAFLFGDEQDNPIGESTTVGLADIADATERGLPGSHEGMYGPGQGIMGPGGFLSLAEAEQAGYDVNRLGDWTARVFSTLGEYPEAAMDWLTSTREDPYRDAPMYPDEPYDSDELGANRLEYWYGRRDSGLDGFEGVLALWEGAQSIPGGPTDGTAYIPEAWDQASTLSHDVIARLIGEPRATEDAEGYVAGNPHFDSENVSELGSVKLVQALAPQIPGLVEHPMVGQNPDGTSDPTTSINPFGIEGDPRVYANLSPEALARILGIAGSNSGGAEALQAVVNDYQNTVLGAAELGLYSPVDAATRVSMLQSVLDGSTAGVDLGEATRHDEAVQSAIGVVETGVGMLPIPGLDKLVGTLGDAVAEKIASEGIGYVRGQLTDAATGAAGDAWAGSHEDLLTQLEDGGDARLRATQISVAQTLMELSPPEGLEAPSTDDAEEWWDWVQDNRAALDDIIDPASGSTRTLASIATNASNAFDAYQTDAEG